MSKIEKKEMQNIEMIIVIKWFNDIRNNAETHNKFDCLPIKVQFALKRNIDELIAKEKPYEEFRNEKIKTLQEQYFTDEKANDIKQAQVDEQGNPVMDENGNPIMVDAKQIKDEFKEEYEKASDDINKELEKLLAEKEEVQLHVVDMESILDKLPDDAPLNLDDIGMLSFMEETERDEK